MNNIFLLSQDDPIQVRVRETYYNMHTYQTVDFVRNKITEYSKFNKAEMTIMQALEKLNLMIDESDPDVDIPNIVHAFQTAERIRKYHPDLKWFQLTGLIHDLGKIMALFDEPHWCVSGDTYPVGCAPGDTVVYREKSFQKNPDMLHEVYSKKLGMYSENCGLDNLLMIWGHDEYMYRVLKNHASCKLPEEALYMIRFHSFYPWHTSGDYKYFCSQKDHQMLPWIKELNRFDLYTKSDDMPDIEQLIPYYQSIIDEYVPGLVKF